ncbi:hypothetical protein [Ralstonia sp. UBA689]|uniref:hypothetical protein n=1 Tax=Ralstonia sp. UBA689 TaxID=1947373 RepID=UPI0025EA2100|nr:hypothetical protein [Ralstonia sp. UBA689]
MAGNLISRFIGLDPRSYWQVAACTGVTNNITKQLIKIFAKRSDKQHPIFFKFNLFTVLYPFQYRLLDWQSIILRRYFQFSEEKADHEITMRILRRPALNGSAASAFGNSALLQPGARRKARGIGCLSISRSSYLAVG